MRCGLCAIRFASSVLDELATKSLAVFCFRLPRRLCVRLYRCAEAVSQILSRFSLAHARNGRIVQNAAIWRSERRSVVRSSNFLILFLKLLFVSSCERFRLGAARENALPATQERVTGKLLGRGRPRLAAARPRPKTLARAERAAPRLSRRQTLQACCRYHAAH